MSKKLYIGCDHAALHMKNDIIGYLNDKGYDVEDLGPYTPESVDYPEYAEKVGKEVVSDKGSLGILICGTGIGMSIVANKVKGIRCGHCHDVFSAKMTRLHNDANVLALGERVVGAGLMLMIVDAFLNTEFSGDQRHVRRVEKIKEIEKKNFK